MPVSGKWYAVTHQARRILIWDAELEIATFWERYESAKVMLAELKTWKEADTYHAARLRAEAEQEIASFESRFPDAQYHVKEIWEYEGMPSQALVQDFYNVQEFADLHRNQALWERISESTLDLIPGQEITPAAQWRVTLPSYDHHYSLTWMIYQHESGVWYENVTPPDDIEPGETIKRPLFKRGML